MLTTVLIDQLDEVCEKHKGEQQFSVNLLDLDNKIMLQLDSKNKRINADNMFTNELEKLGLQYKMLA